MSSSALLAVVVASLMGSLHCAGMCGSLVALYAGAPAGRPERAQLARAHGAYHGARLLAYVSLGVLAGALGGALDLAATAAGLGRMAALAAGAGMASWGLVLLVRARRSGAAPRDEALVVLGPRPRAGTPRRVGVATRLSQSLLRGLAGRSAPARGALLGLLSGLLPCGWLYAFVLGAAATAHPGYGALVMAAFWSGTVPILLGLGVGFERLLRPVRRHLPTATALCLITAGAATVLVRGNVPEDALRGLRAHHVTSPDGSADEAAAPGQACPLHGGDPH